MTDPYSLTMMRVVLVFIRLRSVLFEMCRDHPVAFCETCRRGHTSEQLGTAIGNGCYLCHHCGSDLRQSLIAHARSCPNLASFRSPAPSLARSWSLHVAAAGPTGPPRSTGSRAQ